MSEQAPSKAAVWGGRVVSALPVLGLLASGTFKLMHKAEMVSQFTTKLGYPESILTPLGIVEIVITLLYAVPQTSVLGAILVTGYLGGATATHVRIGDPAAVTPVVLGVFVWLGLFLREPRLRALLPIRR
jgi:hypothetical protein